MFECRQFNIHSDLCNILDIPIYRSTKCNFIIKKLILLSKTLILLYPRMNKEKLGKRSQI